MAACYYCFNKKLDFYAKHFRKKNATNISHNSPSLSLFFNLKLKCMANNFISARAQVYFHFHVSQLII